MTVRSTLRRTSGPWLRSEGWTTISDLADRVIVSLRSRQTQAITLGDDDQELWDALAQAAHLHRPAGPDQNPESALPRCRECNRENSSRVWPCQTLRLIAGGLGLLGA